MSMHLCYAEQVKAVFFLYSHNFGNNESSNFLLSILVKSTSVPNLLEFQTYCVIFKTKFVHLAWNNPIATFCKSGHCIFVNQIL